MGHAIGIMTHTHTHEHTQTDKHTHKHTQMQKHAHTRAGRYDGIYRATVEMCLPGEIWPYRFNRGILLF